MHSTNAVEMTATEVDPLLAGVEALKLARLGNPDLIAGLELFRTTPFLPKVCIPGMFVNQIPMPQSVASC